MTSFSAHGTGTRRAGPPRILLVEDATLDLELTLAAFREVFPKSRVETVRTGEEALARLEAEEAGAPGLPDLVLLDLGLPGISGHDVLRRLRARPGLRRLPVVIFSSSNEASDRATCYDRGANGYLVKPGDWDGYVGLVQALGDFWFEWNAPPPGVFPDAGGPDEEAPR